MTWIPKQVSTEKISALTVQERTRRMSINFDELDPALAFAIGELEEAATLKERERIINLLGTDEAFDAVFYDEDGADGALALLIKMIKGENK
jgi:hypothetical protein